MYDTNAQEIADILHKTIEDFEHFLPAQAPIKDFVHHNTLHGFQHLPFNQALVAASEINGANGFIDESRFRTFFQQGRITDNDLDQVLLDDSDLDEKKIICKFQGLHISSGNIIKILLKNSFSPISTSQLNWQSEELNVLSRFDSHVSESCKKQLLKLFKANNIRQASTDNHSVINKNQSLQLEAQVIDDLWQTCLKVLGLEQAELHPEEILDYRSKIIKNSANTEVADNEPHSATHRKMQKQAAKELVQLLDLVGEKITFRGLLLKLTGEDILDDIQPIIIRYVSSFLDLGFSPLHLDRTKGFYQSWRSSAKHDLSWVFESLSNWHDMLDSLPDNSLQAVIAELQQMGIKQNHWPSYLKRLVMEIPGWSGMFFWFHENQGYGELKDIPVEMMDYLAVRLILERIFSQKLCNKQWQFDANLDMFRWYFRHKSSEFMVRLHFFKQQLPEYLTNEAQKLLEFSRHCSSGYCDWQELADLLWNWLHVQSLNTSPTIADAKNKSAYSVCQHAWQLFKLSQHLGIPGYVVASFTTQQIEEVFSIFTQLTHEKRGFIWLQAYEINYRETILNMLANNRNRGNWKNRQQRPEAQTIFCMDDREEAFRRHMEEINPNIETFGAAAHYNVFIDYQGATDDKMTRLCPVVAIPAHEIHEQASANETLANIELQNRFQLRKKMINWFHQNSRIGVFGSALIIAFSAPLSLLFLIGKTLLPQKINNLLEKWLKNYEKPIHTDINTQAKEILENPTPEHRQMGFSDTEQADRVEVFLRNIGLIHQFSPLVVIFGHGSMSKNNPHLAAYDCGACSGRHSGPNARTLAQFANRPEIRTILSKRGITIPDDCLFIGAEHNTCDESMIWYDLEKSDKQFYPAIDKLKQTLIRVTQLSAHERCRKLASAPKQPSLTQALKHIVERGVDFSQARPELGHATNACAFIGRRSLTQGAFLDRRSFLISYNPSEDPDGTIVERLLLANGPVGAGISLEYYFSTVDNERYGSGSKVTHNVSGLFGVMDGTSGDLRTGLPRQMIEIHEAMRLQVIVEASVETLTKIYQRQPDIQELVGNGWILLCSVDPDSGEIFVFTPQKGFEQWAGQITQLPTVKKSQEWYDGYDCHLPPALIETASSQVATV
ncbi:MAG: DUF2309 domain-containing protein [Pseudomonadota bacterium]